MKSSHAVGLVASLIGTVGTLALPQALPQPDFLSPFYLQLISNNATFNNRYLFACNTGAAAETLCHGNELAPQSAATFTWTKTYAPDAGVLVRNMGLGGRTVPAAMALVFNPGTNVALSWFAPRPPPGLSTVGFDNNFMFLAAFPDDKHFRDGVVPDPKVKHQIGKFYMCWMLAGNYYYNALAWASSVPQNPTCQPVQVFRVYPAV